MRLKQLKLAGFKSFADATTLKFPNPLTAIVGPNGCGKSNVIDAIRWVMGESSAKQLRGGAMADVIFAGSSSRKQMSYASVELVFEQTEDVLSAQLKNEYNLYHELSVRRQVSLDGKSAYFINGTRCRKRDIVSIFLGTGLGARSYAVIEQGMITRLVDAKPDEMRVFIEEAAGVSKYQAKRHETNRHLNHASDNLARLEDVQSELEQQMKTLQRQASTAQRYQDLQAQKQTLEKSLLLAEYAKIWLNQNTLQADLASTEKLFDEKRELRLDLEGEYLLIKKKLDGMTHDFQDFQQQWQQAERKSIDAQTKKSQTLQTIESLNREHKSLVMQLQELQQTNKHDEVLLTQLNTKLKDFAPQIQQAEHMFEQAQASISTRGIDKLIGEQSHVQKRIQEIQASVHLADKQQEHLEKQCERNLGKQKQLQQQQTNLQSQDFVSQINTLQTKLNTLQATITSNVAQKDALVSDENSHTQTNKQLQQQVQALTHDVTRVQTELQTLEHLQQKSLQAIQKNISKQKLDNPVISNLELSEQGQQYADVIEGITQDWLYAELAKPTQATLEDLNAHRYAWPAQRNNVAITSNTYASTDKLIPLTQLIQSPDIALWNRVWLADDIDLLLLEKLPQGASIVTKKGIWYGDGWLTNVLTQNTQHSDSKLSETVHQQKRCEELQLQLAQLLEQQQSKQKELSDSDKQLANTKIELSQLQNHIQADNTSKQQVQVSINQLQTQQASFENEQQQIKQQLQQLSHELDEIANEQDAVFEDKGEAQCALARLTPELAEVSQRLESERKQQTQNQTKVNTLQNQLHTLAMQQQQFEGQKQSLSIALQRVDNQIANMQPRLTDITNQQEKLQHELPKLEASAIELTAAAGKLKEIITANQAHYNEVLTEQNKLSQKRDALFHEEEKLRERLNSHTLGSELAKQEMGQLHKQLLQFGSAWHSKLDNYQQQNAQQDVIAETELMTQKTKLFSLKEKITKIGAVNLAAAQDLEDLEHRHTRLQTQIVDVEESVNKLNESMQKIDIETRGLFMSTLKTVNSNMQQLFPKVFGGGIAQLTLEDTKDWRSGVVLMAQPPGKKNTRLALLSGGEKTLTALSLVFAIFKLNPAPFCVLDEVDAPLDDANIGRYCGLVKELSKQVQFVFISHNKLAMEIANDMLGVTMPSAGVSKLVSVNLDEAVKFSQK